ncbi:DUF1090 domain-containing protein [Ralstonia sp. SET104]|uniref:DUF1090 domain-containing protein n=1 Tax=Ralstonia sp. SET104 TaxID=2448774 RepID=UPI000F583313|nr:DUF1090 domain-containing protein [Ralstonia sp. SET104]GCB06672.1 hypothetical protein PSUB009319_43030 [Ralstonia sp. SET104]
MKKTLFAAIAPFALLGASSAFADNIDCATKIRAIETQIDYARQHGNTGRLDGLQKALDNTKANCSNAGLVERADRKVRDAQQDVDKAQAEVDKAKGKLDAASRESRKGKDEKSRKARRTLADKERKLREKTVELRRAEADRAALKG